MIQAGQVLAQRYEVQERIGKGGFAVVYRAQDRVFRREVAIKVVEVDELDGQSISGLLDEARFVAGHHHPHILDVYDFGQEDYLAYLVMPLATGGTLSQYLRQNAPLSPDETQHFLQQIGLALDFAHDLGIIHRDIKPQNILLFNQRPLHSVISDFGLAKVAEQSSMYSSTRVSGTPSYMAPEQVKGKPGRASDIYSLGVILFQMLAGRLPYLGDPNAVMYAHVHEPVPLLSELRPDLPPSLSDLLARTMAKEPAQRPQRAEEILQTFRQATGLSSNFATPNVSLPNLTPEEPTRALPKTEIEAKTEVTPHRPTSNGSNSSSTVWAIPETSPTLSLGTSQPLSTTISADEPTQAVAATIPVAEEPKKKRPRFQFKINIQIAFSIGALLLVALLGTVVLASLNPNGSTTSTANLPVVGSGAPTQAAAGSTLPTQAVTTSANSEQARPTVAEALPPPTVAVAPGASAPVPTVDLSQSSGGGISANTNSLAPTDRGYLVDHANSAITAIAFSADGKWVATASADSTIHLWETKNWGTPPQGNPSFTLSGYTGAINAIAFSPDNKTLASAGSDGTVRLWDVATGKPGKVLASQTLAATSFSAVSFSADGKQVAAAATGPKQSGIALWNSAGTEQTPLGVVAAGKVTAVSFSPDGSWLAAGYQDGSYQVWTATNLQAPPRSSGPGAGGIIALQYVDNSTTLLIAGSDKKVRGLNLASFVAQPVVTTTAAVAGLAVVGGSRLVVLTSDGGCRLYSTGYPASPFGPAFKSDEASVTSPTSIAASPDGKTLIVGFANGGLQFWTLS